MLERPGHRVAWPQGGLPAALDPAAAAMLDCFDEPLSASELAADLVAALELPSDDARRSAVRITHSLLLTGHIVPDGLEPMPSTRLSYPPSASP